MALAWPFKDPNEVLDYVIDWSARVPSSDAIASSSWEFAAGDGALEIDSSEFNVDTTTVWLSGGTENVTYQLTNRVVTSDGRTMDQTCKLRIKAR